MYRVKGVKKLHLIYVSGHFESIETQFFCEKIARCERKAQGSEAIENANMKPKGAKQLRMRVRSTKPEEAKRRRMQAQFVKP